MSEIAEIIAHNVLLQVVAVYFGVFAAAHAILLLSRTLRFLAGELREYLRSFAREIEEWRKFFRGT